MWVVDFSQEAKFYLLDNYPYTFELHARIEGLKFDPDRIPAEGLTPTAEENLYFWLVLDHVVILSRFEQSIIIEVIKPL